MRGTAERFEEIAEYKDVGNLKAECLESAENARKDVILSGAKKDIEKANYKRALSKLDQISGWKDADGLTDECREKIKEQEEKRKKKKDGNRPAPVNDGKHGKKKMAYMAGIAAALAICAYCAVNYLLPPIRYNAACKKMENHEYSEAYNTFAALGDYRDSQLLSDFASAMSLYEEGRFAEAASAFEALGDCSYADKMVIDSYYCLAKEYYDKGNYKEAYETSLKYSGYKNSQERSKKYGYAYACELLENEDYLKAAELFEMLGDYKDSKSLLETTGKYVDFGEIWDGTYDYSCYKTDHTDSETLSFINSLLDFGYGKYLTISYKDRSIIFSGIPMKPVSFSATFAKWEGYDPEIQEFFPGCGKTEDSVMIDLGSVQFYYIKRK